MSVMEEQQIYNQLKYQSNLCDALFEQKISTSSESEKFLFKMQRWSEQVAQARRNQQWLMNAETNHTMIDDMSNWLPIGSYIRSPKSDSYYLTLGIERKTLQGCIYIGHKYSDSFINLSIYPNDNKQDFSRLLSHLSAEPTLAIKFCDQYFCDNGITSTGTPCQENFIFEIKATKRINECALLYKPLFPWLEEPSKNIIRLVENWTDVDKHCYFMVTEYANFGELLLFIDSYHNIIYKEKKKNISLLNQIKPDTVRESSIEAYKHSLNILNDGENAYIELIRFLFQQMVQSIYVLHSQGIVHLDISCENLVLHFDENGKLLVKLIDFGRAKKFNKNQNKMKENNSENESEHEHVHVHEYEKYNFNISTHAGKCRYMSPESAMFLKYKQADEYDASKEDIFALGVVLFCMLTCIIPYRYPFYIDENNCVNGNEKYKVDPLNMKYWKDQLDSNFALLFSNPNGLVELLRNNALIDYVSNDSLDLLKKIFTKQHERLSLKELINHKFVKTKPNPKLLESMIKKVVNYKELQTAAEQQKVDENVKIIQKLSKDRLYIQTKQILALNDQNKQQQQHHSPPVEEPIDSLGTLFSPDSIESIVSPPTELSNFCFSN